MISASPHHDRAHYDKDGNIILPSHDSSSSDSGLVNQPVWTSTDSTESSQNESPAAILSDARAKVHSLTKSFVHEGKRQYRWSFRGICDYSRSIMTFVRSVCTALWSFLAQPVWVMNPKKQKSRQYSRFSLFLIDTVRFGGTFAVLFIALFVSLNYESFWKISQSYINPIQRVRGTVAVSNSPNAELAQKLLRSPVLATAGNNKGELLAMLPKVGPPDNRIIIPRLGLNVPLVTPSYKALLAEDWDTLEEDIQDALQKGVVHYPGTARPGQAGNFFVTGHSSYYPWAQGNYKTVFARLPELDVGDEYWVYFGGDKHRYIIRGKKEVKPTNVNVLDQPVAKRTSTLMTCTPVGTTLRRLILTADEIDPETGKMMAVGEQQQRTQPKINVGALPI